MKEKKEFPTISRKEHNKKADSPKGGKISPALISIAGVIGPRMLSEGSAAQQSEEQRRQARLAKQKGSILRGK